MNLNLDLNDIENNMLQQHSQTYFCFVLEKTFTETVQYHVMTPKNCILEAHWKQISVYFYTSL